MMRQTNNTIRNERDAELVAYANGLSDIISRTAAKYDETGEFPFEHFDLLEREGYLKLVLPKEYGGDELSLYEILLVQERLAQGSGSTALAVGWHLMTFFNLRFSRPWKEERFERLCRDVVEYGSVLNVFASEREAGNVMRGGKLATVARKIRDGYVISGRKSFATLSPIVKHFTVLAYVEDEDRIAEFLIEKNDAVTIVETWNAIGMRSTGSHDVELSNAFVEEDALLAYTDGPTSNRFTANSSAYSLQIPAIYLGIASAARDFIIDYAENKYSPSLGNVISEAPHVKQKIGEIEIHLSVARSLLYSLAEKWDSDVNLRTQLVKEVSITKYAVCNTAVKVVELAMNIAGGNALNKDLPLERYFRDVQCGLYNPPHNDMVINQVAKFAIDQYRHDKKELIQN
jgi:alkylation response protein AidB-like acyl-CoA dehydrogenase